MILLKQVRITFSRDIHWRCFTCPRIYCREKEDNIAEESIPQVIREQPDNTALIVNLIESVRNSIPEVKSYDKELYELVQLIEEVRKEIPVVPEPPEFPEIPEVRYYDEQIDNLQEQNYWK